MVTSDRNGLAIGFRSLFTLLLLLLPLFCLADDALEVRSVHTGARISAFCNFVVLATALISVKQFFWPGDEYRIPFHVFNIAITILFYTFALRFLVHHKDYYQGFEELTPIGCILKFFFSFNLYTLVQWVILFAFVINFIYIAKYSKDFYKL